MTLKQLGETLQKSLMNSDKFRVLEDVTFDEDSLILTSSAEELYIDRLDIVLAKNSLGLLQKILVNGLSSKFDNTEDPIFFTILMEDFDNLEQLLKILSLQINKYLPIELERQYQEYLVRKNQYELFTEEFLSTN